MAGKNNRPVERRQLLVNVLYGIMTVLIMLLLRQMFSPAARRATVAFHPERIAAIAWAVVPSKSSWRG